jgi:integrase
MIKVNMRLFQRENGVWYVEFRRGKKKSLRTRNKAEALRLFNKLRREYLAGKLIIFRQEPRITFLEFEREYLDWCENNRSAETFQKAKHVLRLFRETVGNLSLASLRRKHLDDYVSHLLQLGYSRVTVNIHIRTIKAALSKAVEWEYIGTSPFSGYKQLKVHQKPPRFLMPHEVRKIEETIDKPEWLLVFRLLIYTGIRRGELTELLWKDIDLERGLITIRKTKNFQSRVIPIHPNLKRELLKWHPAVGKVVSFSKYYITQKLKEYFTKAGFPDLRVHDLRHTFASLMVMAGVDLKTVQELLGHTTYKTTEIYAHLAPHHLHDAIKKLPI